MGCAVVEAREVGDRYTSEKRFVVITGDALDSDDGPGQFSQRSSLLSRFLYFIFYICISHWRIQGGGGIRGN